jgi:hypothetical protein
MFLHKRKIVITINADMVKQSFHYKSRYNDQTSPYALQNRHKKIANWYLI